MLCCSGAAYISRLAAPSYMKRVAPAAASRPTRRSVRLARGNSFGELTREHTVSVGCRAIGACMPMLCGA